MESSPENAPEPIRPSAPGTPQPGQQRLPSYSPDNPYAASHTTGSPDAGLTSDAHPSAESAGAARPPRLPGREFAVRLGAFVAAYVLFSFVSNYATTAMMGARRGLNDPTELGFNLLSALPILAAGLAAWFIPRPMRPSVVGTAVRPGLVRVVILTALAWLALPIAYGLVVVPLSGGDAGGWLFIAVVSLSLRALAGLPTALVLSFTLLGVLWPLFVRRGFRPASAGALAAATYWGLIFVLQAVSLLSFRGSAETIGTALMSMALFAAVGFGLTTAAAPLALGRSVVYRTLLLGLPYAAWSMHTLFLGTGILTSHAGNPVGLATVLLAPAVLFVLPCVLWARADARRRAQVPTPVAAA